MTGTRYLHCCGVGALALAFSAASSAALAQDATSSTAEPDAEIVVTAQKRDERLQDVPISISAFSGSQLETRGITSSSDLTQVTPGLTVSETSSYVNPFIRGVGSTAIIPGEVGSVSTYIDGVYMPVIFGAVYELANIESVQVLKGPQGTLFGRNTAGGAILIATQQPGFTWRGKLAASYGNSDARGASAYVNGPLTDTVAVSLLGDYSAHDGYLRDIVANKRIGAREAITTRGALLFQPSDRLKMTVNADYMRFDDPSGILAQPRNGYLGKTAATPDPSGFHDIALSIPGVARYKQYGGSLRSELEMGAARLVSITAKRKGRFNNDYDSDGTPIARQVIISDERTSMFSQEVQLVSTHGGPLNWVVGGFFSNQNAGYGPVRINTTVIRTNTNAKVYAVFADGTYKFGDFELTGGLRYNVDKHVYNGSLNGVTLAKDFKKEWKSWTPRAVVAYHPSSAFLTYASYSKGFKSGAFNQTSFSPVPIDPERITAYEVGVKLQPSRQLTLNAAAFLYDSKGLVVQTQNPVTNLQVLVNAAAARTKGGEIEATIRPVGKLSINAGISYLDARYRDFTDAQAFVPNLPGTPPALPDSTGNRSISIDASGNRIVRSPEWAFNLGVASTFDLPGGGAIVPSANLFRSSSFFFDSGNRLEQEAYTLVNAQRQWRLPDGRFTITSFGKNLTDEEYLRSFSATTFTDRAVVASPRTYGVKVGYDF